MALIRKKGAGRKLADGRVSEVVLIRELRSWFKEDTSVSRFLNKFHISRQTYYRLLKKHPLLKNEVMRSREELIVYRKERRRKMLAWMKDNPYKSLIDYHLKDLTYTPFELTHTQPLILGSE